MGAKSSVATIQVAFEGSSTVFSPGDVVRGKAYLSVTQEEVNCVSIGSRILGQEKTKVTYTTHSGSGKNRKTHRHTARECRNFLDSPFCLQRIPEGRIVRGQYEYPFSFTIPRGCPASMETTGGKDQCGIVYSVEVWLDRPGMLRWDIRSTMQITVLNSVPPFSKTPIYIEPHTQALYSMCCIHRGEIVLGGSAESSALHAGERTSVKYAAHNNSTAGVKAIEISLDEKTAFSARGHHAHKNVRLFFCRISASEARLDLAARMGHMSDTEETLRSLNNLLESSETEKSFTIPASARSSYNGSIILVVHTLTIRVCTTFGTANPSVSRNIAIYSKATPEQPFEEEEGSAPPHQYQLPSDWAPVVAEAVVLPPLILTATVVHDEENDKNAMIYPSAPPITDYSSDNRYNSVSGLIKGLRGSYDPCGEVNRFIAQGNVVDSLQPKNYFDLFSAISSPWDQQRVADILAAHLTFISCERVARAAAASQELCQREVVETLLKVQPLVDRENSNLVMQELTPFQRMTVEKYFR